MKPSVCYSRLVERMPSRNHMFEWHTRFSEETGDVEYEEQHGHPVLMKMLKR
jgi:hypothetical protein